MKKKQMVAVIALVVAMLVMALPAYAADPNPGEGNTDVVVTNTNQNTGAAAASVTAIYYNQSGAVEYSRPRSINSRGSYNFKASDAQLGDNWKGSMVVQSDAELAAVAEIHWTGGSFSDGKEADAYTGYAQGASDYYFPFVVRAPNAQYTALTVQNTEDSTVTIQMTYINRNGVVDFQNVHGHDPCFWLQDLYDEPAGRQWRAEPGADPVLDAERQHLDRCGQGDCPERQEDRRRGQQFLAAMVRGLQRPRSAARPKATFRLLSVVLMPRWVGAGSR